MSDNIKILIVRAGSMSNQQHITTLCNYLARSCFSITFVSLCDADGEDLPEVLDSSIKLERVCWTSRKTFKGILSRIKASIQLRKIIRKSDCDIIYVIDSWTLPFYRLAALGQASIKKAKLVYHTFDMLEPGVHSRFHLWLEKSMCHMANLVINTDRARARFQQTIYRLKTPPVYIRNCLSHDVILPPRNEELRKVLVGENPPVDTVLLVYPTAASAERLTMELIQAFEYLPDRYRMATIVKNDEYGNRCRDIVKSSGLSGRITFHAPVSHARITELIACADIGAIFHNSNTSSGNFMCNPGRLPLFVALGIPFVATNVPNLEADVYRFGLGQCCDPYNSHEIAEAIKTIADNPIELRKRSLQIKNVFEKDLYYEKYGCELVAQLKFMVQSNKG